VIWPDRFDARCPDLDDLTDIEIEDLLEVPAHNPRAFTEWEITFCASLLRQMGRGFALSAAQLNVLRVNRFLYRLWDNDIDLWEFEPDDDYDRTTI
jgi:hypothetical protein